ncbi:MAG: hypothetical protein JOZ72_16480 [Alphaproteobacteria bacterium]|nr:hypothetical protein [Alphaproteobacteria bacterium]
MRAMFTGAIVCALAAAPALAQNMPVWRGYAGNAQHSAPAPRKAKPLNSIRWKIPVDTTASGSTFLIHFGSPMITASNTVLVPVKTSTGGAFRIEAHSGKNGKKLWQAKSDFILAPHDWIPSFPAHLTAQNRLYFAGAGGTVYFRDTPDLKTGNTGQLAFYGLGLYEANKQTFNSRVMISTPITADDAGNIFFGFEVQASNPANLKSGIARIAADGTGSWVSAADASGDTHMLEVPQNCAPALSADGSTVYIAVSDGSFGYLLGLNSTTLAQKFKVRLKDPKTNADGILSDDSSAAPVVGPDGDVYYGIIESDPGQHNGRGWLLHYSANLATTKTPGSFGWDDTPSVVPASAVPSYSGSSPYLLMSKYNNYFGFGNGNGHNEIAILAPDDTQQDRFSSATVMKEIMTKVNPTHVPGQPQGVVYEWCINSAVVDAAGKAVIANAEDGSTYRWDLVTGDIKAIALNQPTFEAYTPTEIGPDGTVYAINDAILYALGK